jgi:hypothetical protein
MLVDLYRRAARFFSESTSVMAARLILRIISARLDDCPSGFYLTYLKLPPGRALDNKREIVAG